MAPWLRGTVELVQPPEQPTEDGSRAGPPPDALELTLRDGTPAMVWSLSPDDARGLRQRYEDLSAESRYQRFLSSVRTLSPGILRQLVDEVDGIEHVALVLSVFPEHATERAVGVGRIVRLVDRPDAADVAVTVDEAWRGRGVATALLAALVDRRPRGVVQIRTQVAADNRASRAMLARLGPTTAGSAGAGVVDVQVDLHRGDDR